MALCKNVMEELVQNIYEELKDDLDCCQCSRCKCDVIAYALNQLPPKYVVTPEGETYSKTYSLSSQYKVDMISALSEGARIVRQNPRH